MVNVLQEGLIIKPSEPEPEDSEDPPTLKKKPFYPLIKLFITLLGQRRGAGAKTRPELGSARLTLLHMRLIIRLQ